MTTAEQKIAKIMELLGDLHQSQTSDRICSEIGEVQDMVENLGAMISTDAEDR
jgi:hypothetical protein